MTWNPHKLLGTLLQCSTLHLKENVRFSTKDGDDDGDDGGGGGGDQQDSQVPCGKL